MQQLEFEAHRRRQAGGLPAKVCMAMLALLPVATPAHAQYVTNQIARLDAINREPTIGDKGVVAWQSYDNFAGAIVSDIHIYRDGRRVSLKRDLESTIEPESANSRPIVEGDKVIWVATFDKREEYTWDLADVPHHDGEPEELPAAYDIEYGDQGTHRFTPARETTNGAEGVTNNIRASRRVPSGDDEICLWSASDAVQFKRITVDSRNDISPSLSGDLMAWQRARGWPFGWEIMAYDGNTRLQLTTNHYYDMGPKVQGNQITWYGWDGNDFEIFLYDHTSGTTHQITTNSYDDVSPVIWDGVLAWEAYPSVESDIYIHKDGTTRQLSNNLEDDFSPRVWNGQVVWQGFDGDDFEIYYYDGKETRKLTSNTYDDVKPDFRDGVIVWMGYHDTWDAEIFAWNGGPDVMRLTDNDYDDRDPHTAGGKIVWQADKDNESMILLLEPKP